MPRRERSGSSRPFWSGTLTFGLVSVPVGLYAANRPKRVSLRMVDAEGTPLARRFFSSSDGRPLDRDEIIRGFEIEKDHFVTVTDEDLESLAPEKSREIDLRRFVDLAEVDPVHFERGYFLAPEKGAAKAYRLLATAMEKSRRAGIATFVMRDKQYLVAILAEEGLLRVETLRFPGELRSPEEIGLPPLDAVDAARVRAVEKAMKPLAANVLDTDLLADRQSERLLELVRRKIASGEDVVAAPAAAEPEEDHAEGIDLMSVLRRSLADRPARRERGGKPSRRKTRRRSARSSPSPRSKEELYRRARELRIEGRSGMNKKELAEAIRKAG